MKSSLTRKEKIKPSKSLLALLDELGEEYLKFIKLVGGLKVEGLTEEQTEDLLGEISVVVTHLRIHSEQVEKALEEDL